MPLYFYGEKMIFNNRIHLIFVYSNATSPLAPSFVSVVTSIFDAISQFFSKISKNGKKRQIRLSFWSHKWYIHIVTSSNFASKLWIMTSSLKIVTFESSFYVPIFHWLTKNAKKCIFSDCVKITENGTNHTRYNWPSLIKLLKEGHYYVNMGIGVP